MLTREATAYQGVTLLPTMVCRQDGEVLVPGARLWEDGTAGEDADSHCLPRAV